MKSLKNKRLLLLGGNMWRDSIKKFADEQGIVLIAVSNDPNAGIFEIAEESYLISSTDEDAMKKFIIEKNIDGVYLGSNETVISKACEYLADLNLPCYCTKDSWQFIQNKAEFKKCCDAHGLPVIKRINIAYKDIDIADIDYPVICKPTDGCGSTGFSVSYNKAELKEGYKKAAQASDSNSVIVEKFVNNDGVVVFYTFSNGKAYFSGIADKYPLKYEKHGSYVNGLNIFPSKVTKSFRQAYEDKIQAMFTDIGIKEGSIWIEVFNDSNSFYFNEAGYRYSGSITIYPVDYFFNINQMAADIYYALTGESKIYGFSELAKETIPDKDNYCIFVVHLLPGKICKIEGINEILNMKQVVAFPIQHRLGDYIKSSGTVEQVYGWIHFVFNDEDEWRKTVFKLLNTLRIEDKNGTSMINKKINSTDFKFRY